MNCETQAEIDYFWDRLGAGGQSGRCGWLKDKFGLWWQIVPSALGQVLRDPDAARAARVMRAMMKINKIDITLLRQAYDQP